MSLYEEVSKIRGKAIEKEFNEWFEKEQVIQKIKDNASAGTVLFNFPFEDRDTALFFLRSEIGSGFELVTIQDSFYTNVEISW